MQSALARTLALSGKPERAVESLRMLEQLASNRYVSPVEFMTTAFAAGDRDAGYRWLKQACDERCFEMLALKVDPRFESINRDPRFNAVANRVGLS
jgi:hypothetical protein